MGGSLFGHLHSTNKEMNPGLLRTNPDSGRVEDWNQGPPHLKPLGHSACFELISSFDAA